MEYSTDALWVADGIEVPAKELTLYSLGSRGGVKPMQRFSDGTVYLNGIATDLALLWCPRLSHLASLFSGLRQRLAMLENAQGDIICASHGFSLRRNRQEVRRLLAEMIGSALDVRG